MRVLVTGANGFVGHHLCRHLLGAGHDVVALVHHGRERLDAVAAAAVASGSAPVVACPCDLLDAASLAATLSLHCPVDVVAHLAAEPPGDGPRRGVNTQGTHNVLDAARQAGVGRVVFTSTMSVFDFLDPNLPLPLDESHPPAPRDAYGAEKLIAEQLCRAASAESLPVPVLRLAAVFGPGKRGGAVYNFLRAALEGRHIDIPANRRVDLLWVEDAAAAVVRALDPQVVPAVYHIGSGAALALANVARTATRVARQSCRIRVRGDGNAFCLDIGRAQRELAFVPTPLQTAMERFLPEVRRDMERPGAAA